MEKAGRGEVDGSRVLLAGRSLGGGVAVAAAVRLLSDSSRSGGVSSTIETKLESLNQSNFSNHHGHCISALSDRAICVTLRLIDEHRLHIMATHQPTFTALTHLTLISTMDRLLELTYQTTSDRMVD